ncbi:hypothetical protein [Arenimonas sp. MALMAid1274]|uniref:hypothetical protein n=1 Tax=Arenimonas sp. MALMAid1274 TaxID=3411630 RepID=UPI003BA3201A
MKNGSVTDDIRAAEALLGNEEFEAVIPLADAIVAAGEPGLIDGLILRASAYEKWQSGPEERLSRALADWERLKELAPGPIVYRNLARLLLKLGRHQEAFDCLMKARTERSPPELLLGFARYYESKVPPDIDAARSYYFRAAMKGRSRGIRRYVELSMDNGKPFQAIAMLMAGLMATPVLALVLGQRRHHDL